MPSDRSFAFIASIKRMQKKKKKKKKKKKRPIVKHNTYEHDLLVYFGDC